MFGVKGSMPIGELAQRSMRWFGFREGDYPHLASKGEILDNAALCASLLDDDHEVLELVLVGGAV